MTISSTIAVIFDFDDTLVPDSTTLFLKSHKISPTKFWNEVAKELVPRGYDSTLGFLKHFLDYIGPDKPLGCITNHDLNEFGKSLDPLFYPGIVQLVKELKSDASKVQVDVKFFIISGGLEEIIIGSSIVKNNFDGVYGCELEEAGDPPRLVYIKRAINFTEKTRYIYEINKGITPEESAKNPILVNKDIKEENRPIPIHNMIYIGDGLTDIPCFSLLSKNKIPGRTFGVRDKRKKDRGLTKYLGILIPKRVMGIYQPDYRRSADLGSWIRVAVSEYCMRIISEKKAEASLLKN